MRLQILAAATGLSLALAGCVSSGGLHPEGTLTDASTLKSERSLSGATLSPAAWPANDWWTGLGDPQLSALIAEALKDNPTLAVADARARQAQAEAGAADAERGPSVNAGANVIGQRLPLTAAPPELGGGHFTWFKDARVGLSWGLDLWGGKRAAWEAAVGQQHAAEIEQQATRIELSTNVARAYVQLAYAYAQQDVAKAEHERAATARQLTQQRVAAGVDNQLQLKQNETEVANADQRLAAASRAIDAARSSLSVLLGKGPDRGMDITRPQALEPAALAVPADLPTELLGHRADLVAARWRVESAGKEIKVAKTEFMPNVSISAMAGVAAFGSINPLQLPARFYTFGPSLSLPIFDGGRLRSNLAGKDAQYDEAVAQYNQTLVRAVNEVADDYDAVQSAQEQVAAQQRAVDAATQAWQLSEQRYKAGVGSYLESLIVRQQLLGAQQRMADLKAQQVDYAVQLIQALGGGFRPQGDAANVAVQSSPEHSL
ncbi:efflux transporter outer membrane subunit [Dyella jiangningensis]|uniref:efflux transporter outer membrane subunit n=1 Tax=Dyella jiangningensis TaxID=1379159 RepID=UPI00240FEE08|nr:efflux transporter outer membrane subunit [Dyella jiangningensis]MDG2540203.1 efflux transporter outer membrane subunit [Dyella jiangningensis]